MVSNGRSVVCSFQRFKISVPFTVLQSTLCFSNVKGITVPTTSLCFILTQVEMAEE